jgi:hypothetical protein
MEPQKERRVAGKAQHAARTTEEVLPTNKMRIQTKRKETQNESQ